MATINRGILDGFFGKVGTVVGSFWKGTPVMRAYVRRIHDSKNNSQLLVRARFTAISDLASAFLSAIRLGLHNDASRSRTTEANVFVKKNWEEVAFDTKEEIDKTSLDDQVYLFVYCPDTKGGILSAPVKRSVKSISIMVPSYWGGMKVHLWGFTLGGDIFNAGLTSDSV